MFQHNAFSELAAGLLNLMAVILYRQQNCGVVQKLE